MRGRLTSDVKQHHACQMAEDVGLNPQQGRTRRSAPKITASAGGQLPRLTDDHSARNVADVRSATVCAANVQLCVYVASDTSSSGLIESLKLRPINKHFTRNSTTLSCAITAFTSA